MGVDVLNVYDLRDKSGTTLLSLGVHRLTGPHTAEMHSHHELELSWVRSGHGVYHIGDRQYDVAPGDVFLLNNTESHGLFLPESGKLDQLVIHFRPSFIWNSLSNDIDYNFLLKRSVTSC